MNPDLQWHFSGQDDRGPRRNRPPVRARLRAWLAPRWRGCLIVVVAAGLIAGGVYAAIAWRMRAVREQDRADIWRLAQLEDEYLAQGDREAASALQDPNDPVWRAWIRDNAYGLAQPGDVVASSYEDVRFAGDEAELTVVRRYVPSAERAAGSPAFTLRHAQFYRWTGGGWVRTAPPPSVWAQVVDWSSASLRLRFPAHDAGTVEPLEAHLLAAAGGACADLGCPGGQVTLVLSASPQRLAEAVTRTVSSEALIMYVAAPALIGAPVDDAAREHIYREYTARLVAGIAQRTAAPQALEQTWLRWELARLDLQAGMPAEKLQAAARAALSSGVSPLANPDYTDAGIWIALDFLADQTGRSPLPELVGANAPPIAYQLAQRTGADSYRWWRYLEEVAALPSQYSNRVLLAVTCGEGGVYLWSAATGALRPLGLQSGHVLWSRDGAKLAASQNDRSFALLDLQTGRTVPGEGWPLAWAPDGERIAVQFGANRFIWRTGSPVLAIIASGSGWVNWSPDGRRLAYVGGDGWLRLASPDASSEEAVYGSRGVAFAGWSADSRYLAAGGPYVRTMIYDVEAKRMVVEQDQPVWGLTWSPAAGLLATVSDAAEPDHAPDAGTVVQVIDLQGRAVHSWTVPDGVVAFEWSPDGTMLAWAISSGAHRRYEVAVASLADDTLRWIPRQSLAGELGWSRDGRWLAFDDDGVVIWSPADGTERRTPVTCHKPAWQP